MKKNGIAVEVVAHPSGLFYAGGRSCNEQPLVEASEYFELLEKYRKSKRKLVKIKRRNYAKKDSRN